MPTRDHHPGAIPPDQRRLAIITCIVVVGSMIAICLIGNWVLGSPVDWFWLIAGTVMVTALIMLFLWVRLSE